MSEHPHDTLPAFALGALDSDEASQVIRHMSVCPACREDVEAWGEVVALLPYTVAPRDPPKRVKLQLLAMVTSAGMARAGAPARAHPRGAPRWMGVITACSLTLALVFGLLFVSTRQRENTLAVQLAESNQHLLVMRTRIEQQRQGFAFIANRTTVDQPLTTRQGPAKGKMFMRPGDTHAVLIVSGLEPLEDGKIYKFWFATSSAQAPSSTFTVGPDGTATVNLVAPHAVNQYAQVMVTVETDPNSQTPSHEIVLQAELPT